MQIPIIDTHCDILSYLAKIPGARPDQAEEIACALPLLQQGNVKMQVCAIYTDVKPGSMSLAIKQAFKYREMLMTYADQVMQADADFLDSLDQNSKIGMVAAIENAAGLAEDEVPIEDAFAQLDQLIKLTGRIAYISLTHHTENRFGGGNYTTGIGLKKDGKLLLDYISGKKIAIDLSHTSDHLAKGILSHIDAQKLAIPVMASHSNFRTVWDHKRNLNHEFAQEVIRRKGLIGINFLRAFLDDKEPERIFEHILHGFDIGAEDQMCFGADFFYTKDFPDKSRHPFYFPLVENASKYPNILEQLSENLSVIQLEKLAYKNGQRFFSKIWRQ
ncbi:dipeptidase [Cecembia lonarensis]|uniref:Membrane dipeptidase (Peptidase family M19) n=1 Tax=Cecembia lonarensis (strain CCUG 58316 / KCTC 22772 / LW9) TaxID=1225176 RepID=K1LHT9_CECL9|nr:membrane dipeptidase [Cecembia lonarensis]EKB49788.1 Membrane dipeptidase (Peptidase family M19) [Cecembia lonarensis LW9]